MKSLLPTNFLGISTRVFGGIYEETLDYLFIKCATMNFLWNVLFKSWGSHWAEPLFGSSVDDLAISGSMDLRSYLVEAHFVGYVVVNLAYKEQTDI